MLWAGITVMLVALVESSTTPAPSDSIIEGESEWDCTNDHAAHSTDPNKFLQSPSGFGHGAVVTETQCATKLQVFSQENGICRCLFTPELRELLKKPCHVRLVRNSPQEYDVLVPSLNRETIEGLYVRQSCYSLLPDNIVRYFLDKKVNPLFFNLTGCRCDWTPEADNVKGRPVGEGEKCERLFDQNFTSVRVTSDEVGNMITVYPFTKQFNMTVVNGGSVFGDEVFATISWNLMGTDFKDINIVARFQSEQGSSGNHNVYNNVCGTSGGSGGLIDLSYNPSLEEYSLRFFTDQPISCKPQTLSGGFTEQRVQVIYRSGVVQMMVNGFACDVSALRPAIASSDRRAQFSTSCPFQVGGSVAPDTGLRNPTVQTLKGVYKRFMVLRNCDAPPRMVLDRIQGAV